VCCISDGIFLQHRVLERIACDPPGSDRNNDIADEKLDDTNHAAERDQCRRRYRQRGRRLTDRYLCLLPDKPGKRGRQAADYAACATRSAVCADQFQGMSSSHRAAGQSAAIFPVTSAM